MPLGVTPALRVGGFVPLTTLDYPGRLACVLFCQGCAWRCRYCHNPALLCPRGEQEVPWAEVRAFLRRRQGLLDAVVFSGWCEKPGAARIGFGECRGEVLPAIGG